jgi:hypothetical protein
MSNDNNNEKNAIEMAQELAGAQFSATIEDNAFVIRPAEAGIALFASITTHTDQLESALAATEELASALEALRDENGLFRQELENVTEILSTENYGQYVARINSILWPVVGITEDGTEVTFEYNENQD